MPITADRNLLLSSQSLKNVTLVDRDGEALGTLDEITPHVDREPLDHAPGAAAATWPTTADATWMSNAQQHDGSTYQQRHASHRESIDAPFAPIRKP